MNQSKQETHLKLTCSYSLPVLSFFKLHPQKSMEPASYLSCNQQPLQKRYSPVPLTSLSWKTLPGIPQTCSPRKFLLLQLNSSKPSLRSSLSSWKSLQKYALLSLWFSPLSQKLTLKLSPPSPLIFLYLPLPPPPHSDLQPKKKNLPKISLTAALHTPHTTASLHYPAAAILNGFQLFLLKEISTCQASIGHQNH